MFYSKFTNLYPIQKTLRFELKPVNETFDYIKELKSKYLKEVVEEDTERAKHYQKLKPLIDDCHREFIDKSLRTINEDELRKGFIEAFLVYDNLVYNKREVNSEEWGKKQQELRRRIAVCFNSRRELEPKELIENILPKKLERNGELNEYKESLEKFKKFSGYFIGFKENRENMYKNEDKHTAIVNRLINENLISFFNNCISFKKIKEFENIDFDIPSFVKEKLNIKNISEAFKPEFYTNLLTQEKIDAYGELLGGYTEENGNKIKGLNEQINLHRQQQNNRRKGLPSFKTLYKQILSDIETRSFILEEFKNDEELISKLKQFNKRMDDDNILNNIRKLINEIESYSLEGIFIKREYLNSISNKLFKDYEFIKRALECNGASIKQKEVFTLKHIQDSLLEYSSTLDDQGNKVKDKKVILNYFKKELSTSLQRRKDCLTKVMNNIYHLNSIKRESAGEDGRRQVSYIKELMDSYLEIKNILQPMYLIKNRKKMNIHGIDVSFYEVFEKNYKIFEKDLISLYSKIRNFLTKKNFLIKKIKINFKNPNFLKGWDVNKESDNFCTLFERSGLYYLGVLHHEHKKIFKYQEDETLRNKIIDSERKGYRKVIYKFLPTPNRMFMKVFFSEANKDLYSPSEEIERIRNHATHTNNGVPQQGYSKNSFNLDDCHKMIHFFKESIEKHNDWKKFNFQFSPTKNYKDIQEFYREVETQGYFLKFDYIKSEYIEECISEGKLLLFQIYNKDFSKYSKGSPNLHTLYWRGIFEENNLKNVVLKLNGEAEVFFRKHSIKKEERTIHIKNKKIKNKQNNKESVFDYELIKDKKYTKDKFFLHVPVTFNFKEKIKININDKVNKEIIEGNVKNIIGIDRGERNLLYYTVINMDGVIVDQGSWNKLDTRRNYSIDYHKKLSEREKGRERSRKLWSKIEDIKSLKKGYLSNVIHELTNLMIKHEAIVCLEDLNFGFKCGRMKFEKQVYQKFEKALIDKLNYFVRKKAKLGDPGHYLKAYQLTSPFTSFQKLGKQSGVLYYVPSYYTSVVDPLTGFVNFIRLKYENIGKAIKFFNSFDEIRYIKENNYFNFSFNYRKLEKDYLKIKTGELINYPMEWTVSSFGERYVRDNNESYKVINLSKELKKLFDQYRIDYISGEDVKNIITAKAEKDFFMKLIRLFNAMLKMRNSVSDSYADANDIEARDRDFILSPIANANGDFFDSRKANNAQPKDADANGAYHIALKGLLLINKIKDNSNLSIKNKEWFDFIYEMISKKNKYIA